MDIASTAIQATIVGDILLFQLRKYAFRNNNFQTHNICFHILAVLVLCFQNRLGIDVNILNICNIYAHMTSFFSLMPEQEWVIRSYQIINFTDLLFFLTEKVYMTRIHNIFHGGSAQS